MSDHWQLEAREDDAGARLDVFLARELGLSRGYVRRLLGRDRVRLGGVAARKGDLLRPGDVIEVEAFRHPDARAPLPSEHALALLAENAAFLAFDKPAGLASQPLDYDDPHSAVGAALRAYPELRGIGAPLECGLLHRLDVQTSGALVFARSEESWLHARLLFGRREVEKRYRARVHGELRGTHEVSLRIDHRGHRMRVVSEGGRALELRVLGVASGDGTSLVDVFPETGAMHQIRMALAHLGHPIVGDRVYGSSAVDVRHWLHASFIRIAGFEASSPLPPELREP